MSPEPPRDFIRQQIAADIAAGVGGGQVVTRFPPEPNGYLHVGHAKSIALNFGAASEFGGRCNLRFDDTNPLKEEAEYVEAIEADIRWLGFDWADRRYFASDYYERLYEYAVQLIRQGDAYVDSLDAETLRAYRGTPSTPGQESPDRGRPVTENLDLFTRMRAGEFADGTYVLRAKIDMAHPNFNLRDPTLYRILTAHHHRTGDTWCIYPMYDFAHGLSDAIEGVTHSLCTLEFEHHRPLYDWFLDRLDLHPRPRQIEFAPLNLTHTVLSKRRLRRLVEDGVVDGWDDPRLPTLAGLRRRGYTPAAIRELCARVGVAKFNSTVDLALLEQLLREDLNRTSPRVMGVLRPLKLVIDNYPEGQLEEFEAVNNPEDQSAGTRTVPFSRELFIERDDFRLDPPKKFFRLTVGREVRLRSAYLITCTGVVTDAEGAVVELHASYDPLTKGGSTPDGRKVKGTLHWVSAAHALTAEVRLYDRLFTAEQPGATTGDFLDDLNPASLEVVTAKVEPSLAQAAPGARYQLERQGYFVVDTRDATPERLVLNRTVALRDSWAKIARQQAHQGKQAQGKKRKQGQGTQGKNPGGS